MTGMSNRSPGIEQTIGLAMQHHQAGRLQQAEAMYRQVLAKQPGHADVLYLLGILAGQTGRNDEAVELLRRVITLTPGFAEAHFHLGNALSTRGEFGEAVGAYRQALALNPRYPEAWNNLGNALRGKRELEAAVGAFEQAVALRPTYGQAYCNMGPVLQDLGRVEEAIAACRRAVELKPDLMEAHGNLGNALKAQGRWDEADAAFRQAIALNPALPECHFNLAILMLLRGEFAQGWREYEWRSQFKDFPKPARVFTQRQWDGSDLVGRTIMLQTEQGFGDTFQFMRYVPLVAARGGRVLVACHQEMRQVLEGAEGVAGWVGEGEALPAFDVYCPLLSLPLAFGTALASIPATVPYLRADEGKIAHWGRKLGGDKRCLRVGLVWAGRAAHENDRNRSMSLAALAPLGQVPGVRFYSLQKGEAGLEAQRPPEGLDVVDWTAELEDFSDTAGLIGQLDLVIAVDTAVVHLAGALGKAVWTLLPLVPDWRWMLEREDSPWYPTMRLFRQRASGDWAGVVRRVCEALAGLAAGRTKT